MKISEIPLCELNERGLRALVRELGPAGMARFLNQYRRGKGDYTRDRHLWLDKLDSDEIWASIMRQQEEAKAAAKTTAKPAKRRRPKSA